MCTHSKNLIPLCPTIQGFFSLSELLTELYIYLYAGLCETHSAPFIDIKESLLMETKVNALAPDISPSADSQPFLPLLSPSPVTDVLPKWKLNKENGNGRELNGRNL
jgi:hypothetical protein